MHCIQAAQGYGWKRSLGRCLAAVELVVFLILSGCFQGAQVTADQEPVARSLLRPIDIDTAAAGKIGRAALAKLGYAEVIKLAERAGFVAYKSEATIQLASYESAVAAGFVPVFSRYAAAAAVTTQADSPLPGPADVAAVGVLVVGLIDAGWLDGQLLRSFGDWLSGVSGPSAMAKGEPKPSPNFSPPTNPPQLPPAEIPSGWRVRQMPPTQQYPRGYWKLEKPMQDGGWQAIDPSTMKPGTRPQTHIEFPPSQPE